MSDFLAAFDEAKQERLRQKAALWDVQPTAGAGDQGSAQSTAAASTLSASALATYIAQQQQAAIARQATDATRRRVYVGSLYYEVKEDEIRIPFSTFGDIVKIEMPRVSIPACCICVLCRWCSCVLMQSGIRDCLLVLQFLHSLTHYVSP